MTLYKHWTVGAIIFSVSELHNIVLAAGSMVWAILASPQSGQTALHLFQKNTVSGEYIHGLWVRALFKYTNNPKCWLHSDTLLPFMLTTDRQCSYYTSSYIKKNICKMFSYFSTMILTCCQSMCILYVCHVLISLSLQRTVTYILLPHITRN